MAKSSLDKKFDQIRKREEEKTFSTKKRSRIVNKFLNNRLAVLGLIIFTIIILASIFAPLLSPYDPMRVDLRSMRQPPSFDHWFGKIVQGEMCLQESYLEAEFQYLLV